MAEKSKFEEEIEKFNINLTEHQKEQFDRYYEMLVEWNNVMNLTGITDYDEVNLKHFTDSLTLVRNIDMNKIDAVIDIGTGAGFPGLPIKIAFPHIHVVLLDSLNKRIKFLNAVIEELDLADVETLHGRAEDYAKKEEYRGQFDLCVSRAVANLSTLSEYCIPFIKIDGLFISYKSTKIDKEVKEAGTAVSLLGGRIEEKKELILPGSDIPRSFILIRKQRPTPAKFPRKAGLPSKEPLSEKTKPGGKKGKKEKQE